MFKGFAHHADLVQGSDEGGSGFCQMMEKNGIELLRNVLAGIESEKLDKMIDVALVLEPLWENALGANWKRIMMRERISELYQRM